jgi:hypothetical protein
MLTQLIRFHEHVIQSYVRAENVSLAHLNYEAAILEAPQSAGKCFNITDSGKPITAEDIFYLLRLRTGFVQHHVWTTALLPLAYAIEWYTIACAWIPVLDKILPQPDATLIQLQPALWNVVMSSQTATNGRASLPPEKGGIGYKPLCTALEGMSQEVMDYLKETGGIKYKETG